MFIYLFIHTYTHTHTPGSMNILFNDFFRKNAGVILGVFPTIWG